MIAEVAFNIPLDRSFHYLIPSAMQASLKPGMRVVAPFGPRRRVGCVVRLLEQSPIRQLKPLRRLLDPSPTIEGERWELAGWLSRYYGCSLGEALAAMVPSALRLRAPSAEGATRTEPESATTPPTAYPPPTLSAHQQQAFEAIASSLQRRRSATLLLHGITGSGKTELYLRAIDLVLRQGRSAICLVPEIALTPQTIDRFRQRFGRRVEVWHSRLSARWRAQAWPRISRTPDCVVVGTRSAIFAPVATLGLIILDEEQETSYKQTDVPRYHAREVARARAAPRRHGAVGQRDPRH